MAESVEQIIRRVAQEVGVDPSLAVAVARQESGLNPKAHNPNGEDSWGLFQGNRRGGMGAGYTPEQLMDPEFNARLMLAAMAKTQKATGLSGGELAAQSQRPADPKGYARSINAMLSGGKGLPHTGSPFNPGGTTVANPLIDTLTKELADLEKERNIAISNAKSELEAAALFEDEDSPRYDPAKAKEKRTSAARFESEADRLRTTSSTKQEKLSAEEGKASAAAAKSDDPRVVGKALVGPTGEVLYRDEDKPTDPSLIEQRGAAAGASRASQQLTLKQLEQLELTMEKARLAMERLAPLQAGVDAAAAMPPGPEQTAALRLATRNLLAVSDTDAFDRSITAEATAALNAEREKREREEFQALQTQRGVENTRAAATAERTEREGVATGLRGLMGLEQDRQKNFSSAMGQYEQTGISTSGRVGGLQQMSQPITASASAEQIAAMLGLDPASPKFQAIYQGGLQMLGGQGGQGGQAQPPPAAAPQAAAPQAAAPQAPAPPGPIASVFQPQAVPMDQFGAPGYAQNFNVGGGEAEAMGDPYDIQEPGGNIAAEGPAPTQNVAEIIKALGWKQRQAVAA